MSGEGDGPRRDANGGSDAFDSLDDNSTEVDDPFAELDGHVEGNGSEPSPPGDAVGARRDDPFDEIGPADSGTDLDDAFERMDVADAAEEDVWESLDADVGPDGTTSVTGDTEHVVSKRTYCQQCPHFTSPPEVACTREGTSILEAVGFDEFRVRNCPMISEADPTFDADG